MEITFLGSGICGYYSSFSHRQTAVSGRLQAGWVVTAVLFHIPVTIMELR